MVLNFSQHISHISFLWISLTYFCHKGTFLWTYIALVDLSMSFKTAGWSKVFSTSFMVSLEFIFLLRLMNFQLLMFLKDLFTTFKIASTLFLLTAMLAFKMFLQVWFCAEFLITSTSYTINQLLSSVVQHVVSQIVVTDQLFRVTSRRSLLHMFHWCISDFQALLKLALQFGKKRNSWGPWWMGEGARAVRVGLVWAVASPVNSIFSDCVSDGQEWHCLRHWHGQRSNLMWSHLWPSEGSQASAIANHCGLTSCITQVHFLEWSSVRPLDFNLDRFYSLLLVRAPFKVGFCK